MGACNLSSRRLLCFAGLLLVATYPAVVMADLTQDQAGQRATKAAAILKSLGIAPIQPRFQQEDQVASHWIVMAGDNVAPVGKTVFGALVYVYLKAQDSKQHFEIASRPKDSADGSWQQFLTTCDGVGVVGYGKYSVGPISFLRCGNVTLHLAWCKGRAQGVPEDDAYRQEAYGALKQMATQIHEAFRAQGVCGSGGASAPSPRPTATPAGPTADTHTTSTPPKPPSTTAATKPPADDRPTVDPYVQLSLGTSRYLPSEMLVYSVTVSSGVPEATDEAPGQLTLRLTRDESAQDMLWLYYSAGLGLPMLPPAGPVPALLTLRNPVTRPVVGGPYDEIQAPALPGEYRLEASFTAHDGRYAETSVPFDVMNQVKRLLIRIPSSRLAALNGSAHITVPFEVAGIPEKREPPTVKAWGTIEFATPDGLISGKGFREVGTLDDREVTPRMYEKGKASDSIEWDIKCAQPGVYRVSFTVTAPYYGTREGQTFVSRLPQKVPGGGPATAPNTAGGDGGRVAAGGTATTTGGITTTGPNTTAGTTTGSRPAAGTGDGSGAISSVACPGYGFNFGMKDGRITIVSVAPGSFAEKMGIKVGWQLKQADGQDAVGMALRQLTALLAPADKHLVELDLVTGEGIECTIAVRP